MRIVVCVKHVPDVQSERRLTDDGRLDRDQGDGTINELDENAVEAAVSLVEQHGGEVVALTVGPDDASDAVRRALQMGAHSAVHVSDDAIAGSDVFGTVTVLAAAVRRIGRDAPVDLVVLGMAAVDSMTSLLPAALAAELDLPQLALAAELTVEGLGTDGPGGAATGTVRVRRELERATQVLTAPLPALVSVTDQANEPRYPNFKGIMAARKKKVETLTLADLGVDPAAVGTDAARTEVVEAAERPEREDRLLWTDDGTAGTRLVEYLVEHKLV